MKTEASTKYASWDMEIEGTGSWVFSCFYWSGRRALFKGVALKLFKHENTWKGQIEWKDDREWGLNKSIYPKTIFSGHSLEGYNKKLNYRKISQRNITNLLKSFLYHSISISRVWISWE